jgi:hypothetical protein
MIPFVFIIALIMLSSFFMSVYLSIKIIIILVVLIAFVVCFFNKKISLFFLISNIIFFGYHYYQMNSHLAMHQRIIHSQCFVGMVLDKKELDKKYLYLINLYSFRHQRKTERVNAYVNLITKKNILIGEFICIPDMYCMQKYNSVDELFKNPINLSAHALALASNIKIQRVSSYQKAYSFFTFLFTMKESLSHAFKTQFSDKNKFFFETIFLGKTAHDKQYRNLFFTWGISHFLARSGLHIQICISVLISFFLFLGFSYAFSAVMQLFFLFFFYFFTFPSISFFRAFLMFFLFLLCKLCNLPTTSLHTLSVTAIITFFMYPYCFLQLGTQLTFFTTCILALTSYANQFINKK